MEKYAEFVSSLRKPRVIFLSLPAGPTVDRVLEELVPYLDRGDVVLDGGNLTIRIPYEEERKTSRIYPI